jgi:phosphonate transport system ATP-binding protein
MLQIKNLTKIYDGGVKALDNVSFDVPDGQFLAVIGLSGSGKSTLLRCINRLIEPTEGQILWNGEDITKASPEEMRRIRRKIGMVFQHFNLVHRSKVITNVLAGRLGYVNPAWSLLNRFPKEDMEKAIKQLERVGIADKADQRADELSGGQQQRVGIARALVTNPEIVFADEPTGNLDSSTSDEVMRVIIDILREQKKTLVMVTHDSHIAEFGDKVIHLLDGRITDITINAKNSTLQNEPRVRETEDILDA